MSKFELFMILPSILYKETCLLIDILVLLMFYAWFFTFIGVYYMSLYLKLCVKVSLSILKEIPDSTASSGFDKVLKTRDSDTIGWILKSCGRRFSSVCGLLANTKGAHQSFCERDMKIRSLWWYSWRSSSVKVLRQKTPWLHLLNPN